VSGPSSLLPGFAGGLLRDLAAASVLVADRAWQEWLTLANGMIELSFVEDPSLGVHETTVYFPGAVVTPEPTVCDPILAPGGAAAVVEITGTSAAGASTEVGVRLRLPPGVPFSLCSFTLQNAQDPDHQQAYVLPFGVPGGAV
jgi:hypothetical protein